MQIPYESLHKDIKTCSSKKRTGVVTLVVAVGVLTGLGVILALTVLERPPPPTSQPITATNVSDQNASTDQCRITLVESIPLGMTYDDQDNATFGVPLEQAWSDLISMATKHIEVASFYWTLTAEDVNVNSSSDLPGEGILEKLKDLPARNVSVRVVTSHPTVPNNSTDLRVLQENGVLVRTVDFGRLTKGVLHSKFWIVDKRHIFIGSANMDWRAFTQVKELGALIYNCTSLARDLHKIFQSFWEMGEPNSSLPMPWPSKYNTAFNEYHPLLVQDGNVSRGFYLSGSPPSFCPSSRTQDIEAILSAISGAEHFVDVGVMEYSPSLLFDHHKRYWPIIDDAIKRAAYERQVRIRLLVSCGRDSNPTMRPFLQSLASLNSPAQHISIQVKLFIVPVGNETGIPFSRVNHNKYMVTDKVSYIGTSNWSKDYFYDTAGIGLVVSEHTPDPTQKNRTLHHQLKAVFNRDWHSQYSVELHDLGLNPDCAL